MLHMLCMVHNKTLQHLDVLLPTGHGMPQFSKLHLWFTSEASAAAASCGTEYLPTATVPACNRANPTIRLQSSSAFTWRAALPSPSKDTSNIEQHGQSYAHIHLQITFLVFGKLVTKKPLSLGCSPCGPYPHLRIIILLKSSNTYTTTTFARTVLVNNKQQWCLFSWCLLRFCILQYVRLLIFSMCRRLRWTFVQRVCRRIWLYCYCNMCQVP